MAKYQQKYAEYKDSGVEWLGEIPREWIPIRLKHLLLESLVYGANEAAEDDNPKNPRYIRITDMNSDGSLDSDTFRSLPMHVAENYLLKDGDILLARSGATVGKSFYYKSDFGICCFAGYLIRARPNKTKLSGKFAYWFFQSDSYWKYVAGSQIKATIQNVSAEKYGYLYLSLPKKIEEQTQISNFLDHETAKIDSLIEKQQQLIQLLKEKRQAVISHAVTKGLNPDVVMKDSGVEWLGQVPEHWEVMQFRRITSLSQGLQIPQSERLHEPSDNTVEYITIKSLNAKDDAYKEYIYKASDRVTCDKSDVLLARTGATGEVVTKVRGAFHNNFFKVSYSNDILRDFLVYILKVKELKSHLLMLAGTTTIPDLNHGAFLGTQIALPSLKEQQEIIDFIDDYLRRSMVLEGKARSAIQLIQERRIALISAAVTGKIDVRNWQNPIKAKMEFSA